MPSDNPTVKSAEEATGMAPLNAGPTEPQPPQHEPVVSDPTVDLPPALSRLPAPFQGFQFPTQDSNTRSKKERSISTDWPNDNAFEDLVKKHIRPEGPVRAEEIKAEDVSWPEGYREVLKSVESTSSEQNLKVFRVVQGKRKSDIYAASLDLDEDRLVGVFFSEQ